MASGIFQSHLKIIQTIDRRFGSAQTFQCEIKLLQMLRRKGVAFSISVPRSSAMWKALSGIAERDWAHLRALRLEMLADTPLAFLETLDDARAEPESQWRARAATAGQRADRARR